MFDIGFTEILLLAVIALVVIGPERLPAVARTAGRTVGKARRFMSSFQAQLEQETRFDELNQSIRNTSMKAEQEARQILNPEQTKTAAPESSTPEQQPTEEQHERKS